MKTPDQRIEHILQRMLADRSTDAPADAIKWAKDHFRTRVVEQPAGLLQRIKAAITVNIAPGELAFGERSAGTGQARQMLFEAGENAIDLRITAVGDKLEIRGQILGVGFENAKIVLSGETNYTANADEMATFTFKGVAAGDYGLTVSGTTAEIVIEELTLE